MMVLLFSLASAFFVGLNNVLIRKGLNHTSQIQSNVVSVAVSAAIFLLVSLALGRIGSFFTTAALMFFLSGLLGPGIGRTLNITSINRIGVSRTIPIIGMAPLFATLFAIMFMDAQYSLYIFAGMALIIFGVFVLSRRKENGKRVFDKKDLLIPLAAAAFGGVSMATTKIALGGLADPIVGATLALSAALGVVAGYAAGTKQIRTIHFTRKEIMFPALSGCAMAAGFFFNFSALHDGVVAVFASVFSTFPLFGVFLSHFFLREEITGRTWLATAIIVVGIVVIQVF